MNKRFLLFLLCYLCVSSVGLAEDPDRPWMTNGSENVPEKPAIAAPIAKMVISSADGNPLPKVINEDEPLVVMANSDIFFDDPITKSIDSNYEFSQAQWLSNKAEALWFINDWANNKSYRAKTKKVISPNQMEIIPVNPTDKGAISCFASRKMVYYREDGRKVYCYAQSSDMRGFKVKDITPPTCGLEISVDGGQSGTCWPIEYPANQFPLPKTAKVCFEGQLFNTPDEQKVVEGFELGENMIIAKEDGISLKKTDVIKVKIIGDDNYKLDREKIKYGVCGGAGGNPTSVSPVNEGEIDFNKFLVPENPYLFLEASDTTGNKEILFIPINIIE
jgi:hypothetical protein